MRWASDLAEDSTGSSVKKAEGSVGSDLAWAAPGRRTRVRFDASTRTETDHRRTAKHVLAVGLGPCDRVGVVGAGVCAGGSGAGANISHLGLRDRAALDLLWIFLILSGGGARSVQRGQVT